MANQSLLLVDADPHGRGVLEGALRKQGFQVHAVDSVQAAMLELGRTNVDAILSETMLGPPTGYEFCEQVRANPAWDRVAFVFLTSAGDPDAKVRGLLLGVDDYIIKPVYIREIATRLELSISRRRRTRVSSTKDASGEIGNISETPVHSIMARVEQSGQSGVLQLARGVGRQAAIYFRDGRVIDAEAGPLQGEDAVYRLLTWTDGTFEVVVRTVRRREVIKVSTQALLMEGMRRLDEWGRLLEQLPPLDTRFDVDADELLERLSEVPDEHNALLKLLDGRRTLLDVIDASVVGDLESLQVFARLYFEGVLIESLLPPPRPTTVVDTPLVWERSARTARLSVPPEGRFMADMAEAGVAEDVRETDILEEKVVDSAIVDEAMAAARTKTGPVASQLSVVSLAFRPSGLRLVDEAVAAAQIEPDLLPEWMREDGLTERVEKQDYELGDLSREIGAADEAEPSDVGATRMRASLGAMRAQLAGEVAAAEQPSEVTERELLTIRPRSHDKPTAAVSTEPRPRQLPTDPPPQERTSRSTTEQTAAARAMISLPRGTGTVAVQRSWLGPVIGVGLLAAGTLLAMKMGGSCQRAARNTMPSQLPPTAEVLDAGIADAPIGEMIITPEVIYDAAPSFDAVPVVVVLDANVVDEKAEPSYRDYRDSAQKALYAGDNEAAIELANISLTMQKSAQTYLIKAQALLNLNNLSDAVTATSSALGLSQRNSLAWMLHGDVLWRSGARDAAKSAYEKYLQLAPNGKHAVRIRQLMGVP